jgi:hypothetical protein
VFYIEVETPNINLVVIPPGVSWKIAEKAAILGL